MHQTHQEPPVKEWRYFIAALDRHIGRVNRKEFFGKVGFNGPYLSELIKGKKTNLSFEKQVRVANELGFDYCDFLREGKLIVEGEEKKASGESELSEGAQTGGPPGQGGDTLLSKEYVKLLEEYKKILIEYGALKNRLETYEKSDPRSWEINGSL